MPGHFSIPVILLSFIIASLAGFAAFESIEHTRYSTRQVLWTGISGCMLGLGVWSMHFTGMLAWIPPYNLYYSPGKTVFSVLAAIGASWLAMHLAVNTRTTTSQINLLLGSVLVGSGICAMHYLGMAAMHFDPPPVWSLPGVLLSFVIAVFASMAAMAMLQSSSERPFSHGRQIVASLLIGLAICGMHYTGMLAMMLPGGSVCIQTARSIPGLILGAAGVGASIVFMLCILVVIKREKNRSTGEPESSGTRVAFSGESQA